MSYLNTLSPQQKANAEIIVKRLNANGITNPFTQAGILAVVSKESAFIPKSEISYRGTPNDRIRAIFGSRLSGYNDAQLTALKNDDVAFFDAVYGMNTKVGKSAGNDQKGDGYKYRGRGFNGITFKGAYKKYGDMIGVDLVKDPDKLNDPAVAADAMIAYFKRQFASPYSQVGKYNATSLNDFKSVEDSTGAIYHANAGWGKSVEQIKADPTGGRVKALTRAGDLVDFVKGFAGQTIEVLKKKPLLILGMIVIASAIVALTVKLTKSS